MFDAKGFDSGQIAKLRSLLKNNTKHVKRELATAVNATARKGKSEISKAIREELAVKKKDIDKTIRISGKASSSQIGATVTLSKTKRIPLRDFGARQNKAGVNYKISKKGGRRTAVGAFQGPKPGAMKVSWRGRVFKRVGKSRLPIVQLFGASPWGAFVKNGNVKPVGKDLKAELKKQVDRRIRFLMLKASGQIK